MNHTKLFKLAPLALSLSLASAAMSLSAASASAAPARNVAAAGVLQNDLVQNVQWRRHDHYHGHYHGYRGRYYRRDHGGDIAAGVIGGLALGAILGAAASAPPPPPPAYYGPAYAADRDWLAYCSSKYRSFDPRSGTYLGYDGLRHPCR